jgi:hypothetical protein
MFWNSDGLGKRWQNCLSDNVIPYMKRDNTNCFGYQVVLKIGDEKCFINPILRTRHDGIVFQWLLNECGSVMGLEEKRCRLALLNLYLSSRLNLWGCFITYMASRHETETFTSSLFKSTRTPKQFHSLFSLTTRSLPIGLHPAPSFTQSRLQSDTLPNERTINSFPSHSWTWQLQCFPKQLQKLTLCASYFRKPKPH